MIYNEIIVGADIAKKWVPKTNVSKEEAQETLKKYIKKYGECNVLLGNEAFEDFTPNSSPLPDCNVIYVHQRALKGL